MIKKILQNGVNFIHPKRNILGRVSCLGREVFKIKHRDTKNINMINQQKVRVDLLMDWLSGEKKPEAKIVKRHMLRKDVYPLIEQQEELPWLKVENIKYLIMDSFAELTDQKFTHRKEGWSFCCHYTDINHTPAFNSEFECYGLLPIESFREYYYLFLKWFETYYPRKRIFFIHFPTKLDTRVNFKERGKEILRIMEKIEQIKPYIQNISIDDSIIDWNGEDKFPYHFSKRVHIAFAEKWKEIERSDNP